jgi:hypothetical protein
LAAGRVEKYGDSDTIEKALEQAIEILRMKG